jgi:hypothetical protein
MEKAGCDKINICTRAGGPTIQKGVRVKPGLYPATSLEETAGDLHEEYRFPTR